MTSDRRRSIAARSPRIWWPGSSPSYSRSVAPDPDDKPPESSGSVEVQMSNPAIPEAVPAVESQPVASGGVPGAVAHEPTGPAGQSKRSKRVTAAAAVGIERLGGVVETLGE